MSFRCAFLGCGPRSYGHARAYPHVARARAAACCDRDPARLQAYGEAFGIARRYTDLDEMLACETPDVVHLVTPPTLRVGLMTRLAEAGVPGVIVEKPICLGADDYLALRALERESRTRFAVNHQLRHHPRILDLLESVQSGRIGAVRFLDASARYPMSGQGVHVLDLLFAFADYPQVESVLGAASGYDDIDGSHPGPRAAGCLITFGNGMRAVLQAGEGAPAHDPTAPTWGHKRIGVYGTHGFVRWWMQGWERSRADGRIEGSGHDYASEDVQGQAGLTNALLDWLEDEDRPCPTRLATSLDEWQVILAGYLSAVEGRPVEFPFDPPTDLLERFKASVTGGCRHARPQPGS